MLKVKSKAMSEYLNVKESAKLLKITPRQVRRLCLVGKIKGAHKNNGHWQIPKFTPVQKIKRFSLVGDICLEIFKRCPIDFSNSLYDRICKYGRKEGYLDFTIAAKALIRAGLDQHENRKKRKCRRVHSSIDNLPFEMKSLLNCMILDGVWPNDFPGIVPIGKPRYEDMHGYLTSKGYNKISHSAIGRYAKRLEAIKKEVNNS
jgi:hypothetical protein